MMHKPTHTHPMPHQRRSLRPAHGVVGTDTRAFAALRARRGGHDRRVRGDRGFSLMEVLIALGIFAVGLVAVAAVFPTAIAIQRETVRDLAGQRTVASARSTIMALARSYDPNAQDPPRNFRVLTYKHDPDPNQREGTLRDFTVPTDRMRNPVAAGRTGFPGGVQPMIDLPIPPSSMPSFAEMNAGLVRLNAAKSFHVLFSEAVRGYPQNIPQTDRRDYYWYPLIQARDLSGTKPTWFMYLMVMQRRGTEAVPEVRAARIDAGNSGGNVIALTQDTTDPNFWNNDLDDDGLYDLIQPGDWILDSGSSNRPGSIHRVLVAERFRITVESPVPVNFDNQSLIYFAVAIDTAEPGVPKRESRSPIVRIEQFEVVVDQP